MKTTTSGGIIAGGGSKGNAALLWFQCNTFAPPFQKLQPVRKFPSKATKFGGKQSPNSVELKCKIITLSTHNLFFFIFNFFKFLPKQTDTNLPAHLDPVHQLPATDRACDLQRGRSVDWMLSDLACGMLLANNHSTRTVYSGTEH